MKISRLIDKSKKYGIIEHLTNILVKLSVTVKTAVDKQKL